MSPTFQAYGLTWNRHVPGEPQPVEDDDLVEAIIRAERSSIMTYDQCVSRASMWNWGKIPNRPDWEIVGWRNPVTEREAAR